MKKRSHICITGAFLALLVTAAQAGEIEDIRIGADNNSFDNPFVQPQDPALSGGGLDQSLQFGDLLLGTDADELLIGRLGVDILLGTHGNDVLIGGTEHFNPNNRDRAFGGNGADIFMWAPGDGSDMFFGGSGQDVVMFGLIGEIENGEEVFRVSTDELAGEVSIDPETGLPKMDVTNSPGFCEVIDGLDAVDAAALAELGLDHLVKFSIRSVRDDFESGVQDDDNGLRVTLHLRGVEVLVCTNRDGGSVEILDLTVSPPQLIEIDELQPILQQRIRQIVF